MLAFIGLGTAANIAQIISVIPLLGVFGLAYKHFNCVEPGCRWLGHPSRNHRCPKHGALIVSTREAVVNPKAARRVG
jgi:hypothetical protein